MSTLIFLDWETRSKADIVNVGLPLYAADPSTFPLMLAYGTERWQRQWILDLVAFRAGTIPSIPSDLRAFIKDPRVEFHAHNAAFEITIWEEVCVKRWGWPSISLDRWHCTAAKGSAANQPRALDKLTKRLGLAAEYQKDQRGKALIKAISCPVKALKTAKNPKTKEINKTSIQYQTALGTEFFEGPCDGATYFFNDDPELMTAYQRYNMQDIIAEMAADKKLPPVTDDERAVWLLDRQINQRGIPVDLDLCRGAMKVYKHEVDEAHARIADLTNGDVEKCTQRQRIVEWLNERVNFGDSLKDDDLTTWLESYANPASWFQGVVHPGLDPQEVMPAVLEVLELRQLAGGTAVAKYQAALDYTSADSRARDQLLYYGAATGRWTGKGIQPHNMKRSATPDENYIAALKTGDRKVVEALAEFEGTTVFKLLKAALRGIICAPAGRKLIVSDFAGIESRVLNWLCRNQSKLDLFRRNQDTYLYAALDVYGCELADIAVWNEKKGKWTVKEDHSEKRQIGKICELALGYGMGAAKFQDTARRAGSILEMDFAVQVVHTWRTSNPEVPEFWYRIEKACKAVIGAAFRRKRLTVDVNGLKVYWEPRGYLAIRLPSGRSLFYYAPIIDSESGQIFYYDGGKAGKVENKGRINTYGGKLTENIVQAISRDLLVYSMQLIDAFGLDIIFHVHDESVVETDLEDDSAFGIVHKAMQTVPPWGGGIPLMAETKETIRYTK